MKAYRKAVEKDLSWLYFDNDSGFRKRQQVKDEFFFMANVFFLKNRPIYFYINSTNVIRPVKRNQLRFYSIEINKLLPAPAYSASWIRFTFRSQLQLLPQIRCLIILRAGSSIFSIDSNVTDNIKKQCNTEKRRNKSKYPP